MLALTLIPRVVRGRSDIGAVYLVRRRVEMIAGIFACVAGSTLYILLLLLLDIDPNGEFGDIVSFVMWVGAIVVLHSVIKPVLEKRAFRTLRVQPDLIDEKPYAHRRKQRGENAKWVITFLIWGVGAFLIFEVWEFQKTIRGTFGDVLEFIVGIVAFFYFLALYPIHWWVKYMLGDY